MKKIGLFTALILLGFNVCAQNSTIKQTSSEWKRVGEKVWFIREKVVGSVDSIVCLSNTNGCYVATTTLKPVDVYTLKCSAPDLVLERFHTSNPALSAIVKEKKNEKIIRTYFDSFLAKHVVQRIDTVVYKKDISSKTILIQSEGLKYTDYFNYMGSIFIGLWSILTLGYLFKQNMVGFIKYSYSVLNMLIEFVVTLSCVMLIIGFCDYFLNKSTHGLFYESSIFMIVQIAFAAFLIKRFFCFAFLEKYSYWWCLVEMMTLCIVVSLIPNSKYILGFMIPIFLTAITIKGFLLLKEINSGRNLRYTI